MSAPTLQPGAVLLRHIKAGTGDGQATVLGRAYVPTWTGINGPRGFQQGQYELRLQEEGTFALTLPNGAGEDGVPHRERFLLLQNGRRRPAVDQAGVFYYAGGTYRPGDEWLEVWWPDAQGELLFAGTPTKARVTGTEVQLEGVDGYWLTKKARESAAGFWCHAPRDVFEHYTSVRQVVLADDFARTAGRFTHSAVLADTTDGKWAYLRAEDVANDMDVVQLRPGAASTNSFVQGKQGITIGSASAAKHDVWRWEANVRIVPGAAAAWSLYVGLGLADGAASLEHWVHVYQLAGATPASRIRNSGTSGLTAERETKRPKNVPAKYHLAMEGRGRWMYFFLDGQLLGVARMPAVDQVRYPTVRLVTGAGDATTVAIVENAILRRTQPFLLRGNVKGDYDLPGVPPPGGLNGAYFNFNDLRNVGDYAALAFNPTQEPYAKRLDPQPWLPSVAALPMGTASGEWWGVRWTGSIYLDLADTDRFMRLVQHVAGGLACRVWVGKTRVGEEYRSQVFDTSWSGSLRAHLGTQKSGWYPIVVEYMHHVGASNLALDWATSSGGAGASTVPADKLSPWGIFEQLVRHESHYDQLRNLADTYALQFALEPRSLESGEFPGRLVPRTRVGRDTEKVLDITEATDYGTQLSAEETADVLLADAQGLGGQDSQLVAEAVNYSEVQQHLFEYAEYEQLGEITIEALLQQRLDSLLGLRGSVWEEVGANPRGHRELLDKFQLPGELAEFYWQPGDAIILRLPEIGVEDDRPRQIMGVQRPFVPGGLQQPSVGFRQRPRNLAYMLRNLRREYLNNARYYQGQIVRYTGSPAHQNSSGGSDVYSRVALPADRNDLIKAELVVHYAVIATPFTINGSFGATPIVVTHAGRYDFTAYAQSEVNTNQRQDRFYATLAGGTGAAEYYVELTVRV